MNFQPIKLLNKKNYPIKNKKPQNINIIFIQENTKNKYTKIKKHTKINTPEETIIQTSIFTQKNTERLIHYNFELTKTKTENQKKLNRKTFAKITNITKSNTLNFSIIF